MAGLIQRAAEISGETDVDDMPGSFEVTCGELNQCTHPRTGLWKSTGGFQNQESEVLSIITIIRSDGNRGDIILSKNQDIKPVTYSDRKNKMNIWAWEGGTMKTGVFKEFKIF